MNRRQNYFITLLPISVFAMALTGCSGFNASLGSGTLVSGAALMGPISGATVTAYGVSASGTVDTSTPLATATTSTNGSYSLSIPNAAINGNPVSIELTGGSYIEEASSQNVSLSSQKVHALLPTLTAGTPATAALTPLTEMAYQNYIYLQQNKSTVAPSSSIPQLAASANANVAGSFGLTDIVGVQPGVPAAGTLTNDETGRYTSIILAISKVATSNSSTSLAATNGVSPNFVPGSAAVVGAPSVTSIISTANQIGAGSVVIPNVQHPSTFTPIASPGISCVFGGNIVANGSNVTGYSSATASNCSSVTVTVHCTNGVLSPSGARPICNALTPTPTATPTPAPTATPTPAPTATPTPAPSPTPAPISLCTISDLNQLSTNPTGNFVLSCDIDLSSVSSWTSITGTFSGTLDGQGHTISHMTGTGGLFTRVTGVVENLNITGANLEANYNSGILTDILGNSTFTASSVISNCSVSGTITIGSEVGGLVRVNNGKILNSSANINVVDPGTSTGGTYGVGGIAASNSGIISGSTSSGQITLNGADAYVGGIAGEILGLPGQIINSSSSMTINAPNSSFVGGVVGFIQGQFSAQMVVSQSRSTGAVTGGDYTGGVVGLGGNTSIVQSYATGAVNGGNNVGGLAGALSDLFISQSYYVGSVNATGNSAGGLVGNLGRAGAYELGVQDSYARANVSGHNYVGGAFGSINVDSPAARGSFVNRVYSTGSVSGTAGSTGGLIGETGVYTQGPTNLPFASITTTSSNYWNTTTSGQSTSAVGAGLTTAAFGAQSSFTGWDFSSIWIMSGGYPALRMGSLTTANSFPSSFLADQRSLYNTPSGVLYAISGGGVIISSDNAQTWTSLTAAWGLGANAVTSAKLLDNGHLYVGTATSGLYVSQDNGATHTTAGVAQGLPFGVINGVETDAAENIFVSVQSVGLAVSVNHGQTFTMVPMTYNLSANTPPISMRVGPSGTLYVRNSGSIYSSQPNGLNNSAVMGNPMALVMSYVAVPIPSTGAVSGDIMIDAAENIYFGNGPLLVSTDKGHSFSIVNGNLPTGGASPSNSDLLIDSQGTVYFLTSGSSSSIPTLYKSNVSGLMTSTDPSTLTFTPIGSGSTVGGTSYGSIGSVAFGQGGAMIGYGFSLGFMISTDQGQSFTQVPMN